MAQVEISVDTTKKTMVVKVAGKKLVDVKEVYINQSSEYFDFSVYMVDDTLEDLRKITRLSAKENGDLKEDYPSQTGLARAINKLTCGKTSVEYK